MKKLLTSLAILLATFTSFAQAPNRISYQAEVRNVSNNLVINQLVRIRISILQGSNVGASVYTETHTPTTNANGLVSLQIGGGTIVSGTFASINWSNGPYFLKTETDPAGGTNYSISGTNQLLSVPYALFSNTAGNGISNGSAVNQMLYWNGTAWSTIAPPATQGQILTYCDGALTWTIGGICPGSITALACSTATNTGTLTQGIAAAIVSSSIAYTGGNGGLHNGQTVTSTGLTGLTATLTAGSFANGAGTLTYTITGTPASGGAASFALNIGGRTCTLTRTVVVPVGTISALSCSTATNAGTLAQGIAAASVSSTVPYTGGNGGTHSGQTVNSTGVTGLTATLAAGNFAIGAGSLTYTITGTAATSGTASFALNIGGKTCTLSRTVALPVGTITALSCSTATNAGTLAQGIAAASVSSTVPYTGGNGGSHSGQTVNSTGVTGLTATLAAGNFAIGAGSLTYTITGTAATSGTASFALNIGGKTCTLSRTVVLPVGTITALTCSTATNTGTLTQGIAAASASSSVPYTGGNGGSHTGQTVTSTGVTGLTATRAAANFAIGSGTLVYTITGTPASSGTASFALNIGGKTCTLTRTVNIGLGPLNIEIALIPASNFTMGSPSTEPQRGTDEVQHQVTLSAYRMSKYETSNAQYAAFLNAKSIGSNGIYSLGAYPTQPLIYEEPSFGLTWTGSQWQPVAGKENFPVVNVTWFGATEFATYAGGRLPTEAEWEYACRGNTTTAFSTGACLNNTQANYNWAYPLTGCTNTITTYPGQTQAINSYSPNAFGLYNMHGNVWEWCADWYGTYSTAAQTNPTGASTGTYRVFRGGGWIEVSQFCRSAFRNYDYPYYFSDRVGFRLSFAP